MLAVVLDSSAMRADGFLSRGIILRLNAFREVTGATVFVPGVVRREVQDQLGDRVRDGVQKVHKANQAFSGAHLELELPVPAEKALIDAAQDAFERRLNQVSAVELPLPSTPHEEVLERVQQRRRPFSSTGEGSDKGYKDFLLWLSVLELVRNWRNVEEAEIALVTSNTKDFTGEDGGPHLHLLEDLGGLGVTLSIHKSIDALLSERLAADEMEDRVISAQLSEATLMEAVEAFVERGAEGWFIGRRPETVRRNTRNLSDITLEEVEGVRVVQIRRRCVVGSRRGGYWCVGC